MSHLILINQEQPDKDSVRITIEALRQGEIIIYPTETVYGLGVDCENEQAVRNLYRVKKRKETKPFLLIAADREMVRNYVNEVSDFGHRLMDKFWPGPLTIVFKAGTNVSQLVRGGTTEIGIRVPDNMLCRSIVKELGRPITSTSANLSGEKECSTIEQIPMAVRSAAAIILDGGKTRGIVPSTVISITADPPEILRDGAVSRDLIENFLNINLS